MAENSKIEWTDHTFNIREGCQKISPGCDGCYAWKRDQHWHGGENWGPEGKRKEMAPAYWKQPIKWDAAAQAEGRKARVFCSSLADVFELPPREELERAYDRQLCALGALIGATPNLIWLLLTKRPENWCWVSRTMGWQKWAGDRKYHQWPANVFPMTTVESQKYADERIPKLLEIPSQIGHGISYEPALGAVDFGWPVFPDSVGRRGSMIDGLPMKGMCWSKIDWVIAGGESGPKARPSHPDWFRSVRDQCAAAGVPFFFKQHGEWAGTRDIPDWLREALQRRWNAGLTSKPPYDAATQSWRVGKKVAGRLLDGVEYSEYPK